MGNIRKCVGGHSKADGGDCAEGSRWHRQVCVCLRKGTTKRGVSEGVEGAKAEKEKEKVIKSCRGMRRERGTNLEDNGLSDSTTRVYKRIFLRG